MTRPTLEHQLKLSILDIKLRDAELALFDAVKEQARCLSKWNKLTEEWNELAAENKAN